MNRKKSKNIDVLKEYCRRSISNRLWESYALDLVSILELEAKGRLDKQDADFAISELVPKIKKLRDGGILQKILQRIDKQILDKVFNEVSVGQARQDDLIPEADLRDL